MAQDILVPNIGDFKDVEIIEILVKEGDAVSGPQTVKDNKGKIL